MYANMQVSIGRKPLRERSGGCLYEEEVYAWKVDIHGDTATIKLDGNDGESNYAVPIGERVVDLRTHAIEIAACF